ncbi:hypothetical protein ACMX2H_11495 [Arthrobacter sulfonylureivorans]|uniref:hypothetical protein n=1 Tax=Arthrobacter sulfonylureivorans TaxID=2486855 RepID=UPI0039E2B031
MIVLPAMPPAQKASWEALFEIHEAMPEHWTLVGGQAVFLHSVERDAALVRATSDADAGLDLRMKPDILLAFTTLLTKLGFQSDGRSPSGHEHRWTRGQAKIDLLIPRFTGERAESRKGVTGGTTIAAPALQQALDRSETVKVNADGLIGTVNRVSFIGCLIGKAAALRIIDDPGRERHLTDALTLAGVMSRRDIRGVEFTPSEKAHLANLVGHLSHSSRVVDGHPSGQDGYSRLYALASGWNPADPNE